jgi:hypothetical protein
MKNREQPSVDTRARRVLRAPFERTHAGGLNQLFSKIPIARQHQAIAPEARQMGCKMLANITGGNF